METPSSSAALPRFEQSLQKVVDQHDLRLTFEALTQTTVILRHADPSWFILMGVGTESPRAVIGGEVPAESDPAWRPLWTFLETFDVVRSEMQAFDIDLHQEDQP